MDSLSQVLERADVKSYMSAYRVKEKARLQTMMSHRFSLMFTASAWQRSLHHKVIYKLRKEYDIDDNSFNLLCSALTYSWSLDLRDFFFRNEVYNEFYKDTHTKAWMNNQITRLRKKKLIYTTITLTYTPDTILGTRLQRMSKSSHGSLGTLFRVSKEGVEIFKRYDFLIRVYIGNLEHKYGKLEDSRLDAIYFLLKEYFEIDNRKRGYLFDINFREKIDKHIKTIIDSTEN